MYSVRFQTHDGDMNLYAIRGCDALCALNERDASKQDRKLCGLKSFPSVKGAEDFIKESRIPDGMPQGFHFKGAQVVHHVEGEGDKVVSDFIFNKTEKRFNKLLFQQPNPLGAQLLHAMHAG